MELTPPDRLLRVDLSTATVTSERIPPRWRRQFLGGKGIGARYLYAETNPETAPRDPDMPLLFMLGPLSGIVPGETRYAAITKSPLTGGFLDSYSGGTFASRLAESLETHMGLIITGRADQLSAIVVEDGDAEIVPVPELGGADTVDADEAFEGGVAAIGPAGEHEVAYATIASDSGEHHAGRGGAGGVMGAKRLKAVIARNDPPDDRPAIVDEYVGAYEESDVGEWRTASGTAETIDVADATGTLQTEGWQAGHFEGAEDIGIEAVETAAAEREDDGSFPGSYRIPTETGEYVPRGASAMSLGAGLGIDDFDAVVTLGQACDRLGLDLITAGNVAAWTVLAAEEGLIDRSVGFGEDDTLRALITAIATRDGQLADTLAEGVAAAAERYGGDELIPTVKAMDAPPYDPRRASTMALAYATSDRGACHRRSMPIEEEPFDARTWSPARQARVVAAEQTRMSAYWCLIADSFVGEATLSDYGAELLEVVGLSYTPDELRRVGERVWTLTRLFNVREGFDREADRLPAVFAMPRSDDNARVDPTVFAQALDAYYAIRAWDSQGRPTKSLLRRLDMADVPDDVTPIGATPHPGSMANDH